MPTENKACNESVTNPLRDSYKSVTPEERREETEKRREEERQSWITVKDVSKMIENCDPDRCIRVTLGSTPLVIHEAYVLDGIMHLELLVAPQAKDFGE